MGFQESFPLWDRLQPDQQHRLIEAVGLRSVKKGTVLRDAHTPCGDLCLIRTGRLSAGLISDEGREFTLYRLFAGDLCLFCASGIIPTLRFEIIVRAETDATLWRIPKRHYQSLMAESAAVANFTNELIASRFTEVMGRIEQLIWQGLDRRVAAFLLRETKIEGSAELRITHEAIAHHLGTQREVISRLLSGFRDAGLVTMTRGKITIVNKGGLEAVRA